MKFNCIYYKMWQEELEMEEKEANAHSSKLLRVEDGKAKKNQN